MPEEFSQEIQKVAMKYLEVMKVVQTWKEMSLFESQAKLLLDDDDKNDIFLNSVDPRFNSMNWARDINSLIRQIEFGFCWMEAFSDYYKVNFDPNLGPYSSFPPVSYYSDNCILGIYSCRDKVALMVWAYYCPFDIRKQDEVLDFKRVLKRLRHPVKFAIKLERPEEFFSPLDSLNDNSFKKIAEYRHLKVHRKEPKIIMGDIQGFHFKDYNFPMCEQSEIEEWENKMKSDNHELEFIEVLRKNATFDGIQYQSKPVEELLISYSDAKDQIEKTFKIILREAACCFKGLDSRLFQNAS